MTRADMPIGLQMAQVAHAASRIGYLNQERLKPWYHRSKTIVVLAAPDRWELQQLSNRAYRAGWGHFGGEKSQVAFRDPDLGQFGELTAVAFTPHPEVVSFVGHLPLAGREVAVS